MSESASYSVPYDQLERALGESQLGLVITDQDGYIHSVTPKIEELTGYTSRDLIGATPRIFRSGKNSGETYRNLWATIKSGKPWKGALINQRRNGAHFFDRETITCSKIDRRGEIGFIAVHREANEELELMQKLHLAEAKVGETASEIDESKEKIRELVAMTSQQAQGASLALIASMEARDPNTAGHGLRTSVMLELLGEQMGLFEKYDRDSLRIGAILHDIGKIGIPDSILLKPGPLTEAEFDVMKTHPEVGYRILYNVAGHEHALQLVRSHHERLDGSGYPDGLTWEQIPDFVRVFSVIDCFDAMTSPRPYRRAMSIDKAMSILTDDALCGKLERSAVRGLRQLCDSGVLSNICGLKNAA